MLNCFSEYMCIQMQALGGGVSASKQRHIISRKLGGVSVKQSLHYYAIVIHYYEDAQNGKNAIQ